MKARLLVTVAVLVCWACEPKAEGKPIAHWLEVAHKGAMKDQVHAIDVVARMGPPAVPHLLAALGRTPGFTDEVLRILGNMGPDADQAIPTLVQLLGATAPEIRVSAAVALIQIDCRRTMEALPVLIDGIQPDGRSAGLAATAVGFLGADGAPAVPALIQLLDAPESNLRLNAVTALSRIGPSARQGIQALKRAEIVFPDLAVSIRAAIESIEGTGVAGSDVLRPTSDGYRLEQAGAPSAPVREAKPDDLR